MRRKKEIVIDIGNHVNEKEGEIFLPFHVPSSKNSRVKTRSGLIVESKAVRRWRKSSEPYFKQLRESFLSLLTAKEKPYKLGFYFIRCTRHKFDWAK